MRATRMLTALAAIALLGVACEDDAVGIPAGLEVFTATLNGANERPDPTTTPATGRAVVTVMENLLSWRVEVTNINNVVAGHIHRGGPEDALGVLQDLTPTAGDHPTTTVIAVGSVQGDIVLIIADSMRAGRAYVNLHTNDGVDPANTGAGDFPGGEIRGQLRKQ